MTTAEFARPQYLVETGCGGSPRADPVLRVFDCTIILAPTPGDPFRIESGRGAWERGHVPGSTTSTSRTSPPTGEPRRSGVHHAARRAVRRGAGAARVGDGRASSFTAPDTRCGPPACGDAPRLRLR
jgi:hypothetical protein